MSTLRSKKGGGKISAPASAPSAPAEPKAEPQPQKLKTKKDIIVDF